MFDVNMLPSGKSLLCLVILCISLSSVRSMKFNITLQTPDNTSAPTVIPHKSVHMKYALSNENDRWIIVGFEPFIQRGRKALEHLTVHLCYPLIDQSIWYDDKTLCNDAQSMLIYEWTPYSSLVPFRISDDNGFQLKKFKSIVLTVTYRKEKRMHKNQSGIILEISTEISKFQMSTIVVGNKRRGTRFSCRSSTDLRLLYAIKRLSSNENNILWRVHIIRVRQFGRKIVQLIFDSKLKFNVNKSDIEIISSDSFFTEGDYLLIECESIFRTNCYFLIYYTYVSKSIQNENICQNDEFSNLFKLIPAREMVTANKTAIDLSSTKGSTIFLLICILLFAIWVSILIGCIIMRRIRGLKNFRTNPTSSLPLAKNKCLSRAARTTTDNYHQRTGDADHIMQMDGEHAGFVT